MMTEKYQNIITGENWDRILKITQKGVCTAPNIHKELCTRTDFHNQYNNTELEEEKNKICQNILKFNRQLEENKKQ